MSFDPNVYAALQASNPEGAQAYLNSFASASSQPAATAQPGVSGTPQATPPTTPPARGSLDKAYQQGLKGGGHGTAAKFPAVGSKLVGVLARDILDTDVMQETDFTTKQPKFYRDGAERWQMTLPLNVPVSTAHPEGKATVWAKTRLFQSVIRAALAAGYKPGEGMREGDVIAIERVADVPSNNGNPAHDFTVSVTKGNPAPAATTTPEPEAAPAASEATAPASPDAAPVATGAVPSIPGLTDEQAGLVAKYTNGG